MGVATRFGGQAVSLAVNYTNAAQFKAAGYAPMVVNGTQYGETRQYGNFCQYKCIQHVAILTCPRNFENLAFTRVYNAGHEVPNIVIDLVFGGRRLILGFLETPDSILSTHCCPGRIPKNNSRTVYDRRWCTQCD